MRFNFIKNVEKKLRNIIIKDNKMGYECRLFKVAEIKKDINISKDK
tara:strand:- start:395 stop:532 length:138 start_codon:yes stop_codon:yes gene_type:complete